MTQNQVLNVTIEPLNNNHNRDVFSSGNLDLDRYFKHQIGQDAKRNISAPFVLIDNDNGNIAGYYTLSMTSVLLVEFPSNIKKKLPKYPAVPAVLLGRLAIDVNYGGQGLGGSLLFDALERSFNSEIAVYCVVVDAKDDKAKAFYLRYGFIEFIRYPNRLFLPIKAIESLL